MIIGAIKQLKIMSQYFRVTRGVVADAILAPVAAGTKTSFDPSTPSAFYDHISLAVVLDISLITLRLQK